MSRRYVSRQAQAFEFLMSPDSEEDEGPKIKGKSKRGSGRTTNIGPKVSVASGSSHTPGFRLKTEPSQGQQQTPDRDQRNLNDLDTLVGLFGGTFPTDIIEDIFQACGGNQEAAIDALLAMSAPSDNQPPSPPPAPLSSPSAYASKEQQQQDSSLLPNLWDTLPQECKLLIFQNLSLKDLSKAAATSQEFSTYVRSQRQSLRTIIVPPSLSSASIRSLVSAFAAATGIDFSRCGKTLRFPNEFEDAAVAVAAGAANRPATSNSAEIEFISFSKCGELTDGDVAAVCSVLGSLKTVDLSKCAKISDGALRTLARYRRTNGSSLGEEENEEDNGAFVEGEFLTNNENGRIQLEESFQQQTRLETPAAAVERIAAASAATATARRQSRNATSAVNASSAAGGLEGINVAGTDVTSRGITELLRGSGRAPSLLSLDVSRCLKVNGDALVPGPRSLLRVLRASGCTSIRAITLQLASNSSSLQELVLTNCKSLKEVVILAAPELLDLNVSGCTKLTTLSVRSPNLTRLRASGCTRLHIGTFNGAVFECPSLQEVNFFGCRQLESAGLESVLPLFTAVQVLDLSGCVALSRIIAVQGQGLRKLRKLIVDGCAVLRNVAVATTNLRELSARACPRLMEVRVVGSVPKRIDFENCVELREVAIGAGGAGGGGEEIGAREEGEEEQQGERAVGAAETREFSFVAADKGEEMLKPKLVLRGCDRLSPTVRESLRSNVLGGAGGGGH
jgi:F-box domain